MAKGFIYILYNTAMPGLLKVGYSIKVPTERVEELFTTGVPEPFKLAYYCLVENAGKLERQIHENLSDYRHRGNREFFRIELEYAVKCITNLCKPEHEWNEEQPQSVNNDQSTPSDCHVVYGIVISSRNGNECEIKEMIDFAETAHQQSLAPYIRSLFYDSNSCCCNFELADEVNPYDPYDPISDYLLEIALETISQFEWCGYIQHGKPLNEQV
jgi:hypothetical protein